MLCRVHPSHEWWSGKEFPATIRRWRLHLRSHATSMSSHGTSTSSSARVDEHGLALGKHKDLSRAFGESVEWPLPVHVPA